MGSAIACEPALAGPSLSGGERRAGRGSPRRLRAFREVRRVLRTGAPRTSQRVVLYVAPGAGPSRAAWITGKRVGGAVARNRARRLLRETWRSLAPRVREGHELVFVARGPFGGIRAPELIEEIESLLRGAGVMGS